MIFHKCFSQINDTLRFRVPIKYQYPKTETITVLPNDTLYFCMAIKNASLLVKLRGKWTKLDDIKQLDRFIGMNHDVIDSNKILIIADPKIKYADYNPIIDVFKKNDYLNFHLVPLN